jgi:hypothetical protein
MRCTLLAISGALALSLAAVPAYATCNYGYATDEYGVIRNGLSPDKRMSFAAHGEGELGDGDFSVWLMAEPSHRKVVILHDIGWENNLDSCPDAYHAFWSADSRHAAIAFRSSRHEVELNLYSIEHGSVQPIGRPSLFKELTGRDVGGDDHLNQSIATVEWHAGNRFVLREYRTFTVSDPRFVRMFRAYGHVTDELNNGKQHDGKLVVEFSAEADCLLLPGHRYRVVDLRPGKAGVPDWWYSQ